MRRFPSSLLYVGIGLALLVQSVTLLRSEPAPFNSRVEPAAPNAIVLVQAGSDTLGWSTQTRGPEGAIIKEGTGRFVSPESVQNVEPTIEFEGADVQLNFLNTNIKEFARAILVDILGVDYVIDPKLEGSVTVRTNNPVPRSQAFSILSEVLRMNGASVTQKGEFIRISRVAKRSDGSPVDLGSTARIVQLSFVGAAQAAQSLSAFAGSTVRIQPSEEGRYLLMFGAPEELDKLESTIRVFDINKMKGLSFGLFRLELASPNAVASELSRIFEKALQSDPNAVRFVPFSRMNGLLVVASHVSYLDGARHWIGRLDQAQTDQRRIYVYSVQNRRAEELASVLSSLFGGGEEERDYTTRNVAPGLQEQSYRSEQTAGADNAQTSPPPVEQQGPGYAGGIPASTQSISITADKATNSLLINATPNEYAAVRSALLRIDTVPLQVLIEATIAEVTLNDDLQYGVRWFFENGRGQASLVDNAAGLVTESFPGFNYFFDAPKITFVVSALEEVTDVDIVSSPSLTVLDNETANLVVGDQVPIATRSAVGVSDPSAPVVNDIEFRDTGIILSVTPRVNSSGLVVLDIEQEVSDVVETTSSQIDSPTISQRKIKSSVAVRDGRAIILGGLMSRKHETGKSGVPILQRIPKLGTLFRNTGRSSEKTELLVVIKPSVIRNQDDADAIARELAEKFTDIFGLQGAPPPTTYKY